MPRIDGDRRLRQSRCLDAMAGFVNRTMVQIGKEGASSNPIPGIDGTRASSLSVRLMIFHWAVFLVEPSPSRRRSVIKFTQPVKIVGEVLILTNGLKE